MGSGAENIYPLPPPAVLPLGEAAPRTPAPAGAARGEGGAAGPGPPGPPGPGLALSRQPGGTPCFPALGLGAGRRVREGRGGSKLGGLGGGGGRSRSVPRGASSARARGGRGAAGRAGRARSCPTAAAGAGKRSEGGTCPSLPGTAGAGRGVAERRLGRTQSKAKERKLPTPTLHLLKSG